MCVQKILAVLPGFGTDREAELHQRVLDLRLCHYAPFKPVPDLGGNPLKPSCGTGGEYDTIVSDVAFLLDDAEPTTPPSTAERQNLQTALLYFAMCASACLSLVVLEMHVRILFRHSCNSKRLRRLPRGINKHAGTADSRTTHVQVVPHRCPAVAAQPATGLD
jgi:hypothetical protein